MMQAPSTITAAMHADPTSTRTYEYLFSGYAKVDMSITAELKPRDTHHMIKPAVFTTSEKRNPTN